MGVVRKRILFLLCAVAALFIFGIAGWQWQEQRKLCQLHKQESSDTSRIANKLVELRGEKLAALPLDYSYWDEMVDFVSTRDQQWAKNNLEAGMATYGADAIAVYDPGGAKVYDVGSSKNPRPWLQSLGPEQIKSLFSAGPLCHFFLQDRRGLLEVRGAKIVPTADSKRVGQARGYMLACQVWDSSYLNGLATLLDAKASLQVASVAVPAATCEKGHRMIVFRKALRDPDGHTLRTLCLSKRFAEGDLQSTGSRITIAVMAFFAVLMIMVMLLGLSRFVAGPLGLVSSAMETQSPETLSRLEKDPSEFGRLAALIRGFFQQKVALEEETRVRARAEEDARRSEQSLSTTLQSIGDAVIATDADARIVRMNPAAEQLTGWTLSEAIGRPISEVINIVNAQTGEPAPIPVEDVLRTGDVCHLANHTTLTSRDGTRRQIADSAAPIRDDSGSITGVVMVFSDVTEQYRVREALEDERDRAQRYLDVAGVMLVGISRDATITLVNKQGCSLLGYAQHELLGRNWFDACVPEREHGEVKAVFARLMSGESEGVEFFENVVVTRNGDERTISWHNVLLRDASGAIVGTLSSGEDITERKRAEEELRESEGRLSAILDKVDVGIVIIDAQTHEIVSANPSACNMIGAPGEQIVNNVCHSFICPTEEGNCPITDKGQSVDRSERVLLTVRNGSVPILKTVAAITLNGRRCLLESFVDMTERKRAENELLDAKAEIEAMNSQLVAALNQANQLTAQAEQAKEEIEEKALELGYQANHDVLTDLPNRQYFEQHLSGFIKSCVASRSRSLAVLFLDLDRFKLINDTLGHKVGDSLLVEVAERLRSCLRTGDVLARMGGDEFTVILPRCRSRSVAELVAARMIDSISRPFEIQSHRFVIGASIGLASYPSEGKDAVTLLKHADAAMYKAKQAGRGTCRWFTGDVDVDNQQRAELEMDIRAALDKGQFSVYYQPIVSLRDRNVLAAEALLRWEHPEKGTISPSLFIPVAEEIGLIGQIGDYVLRTACGQTVAWRNQGIHLSQIGVNLSTRQVREDNWLNSVSAVLSDTGLEARYLNLELTESDFAADYKPMKEALRKVHELGICMSIDDFGIGQSSLGRLRDFPMIHLKIDGSFIRDIEHNKSDNDLVRSIVEMAHGQGATVTAEWVETGSQMEILRSIGCDLAQGYFISPALSSEAFEEFVREHRLEHQADQAA